MGKILEAFLTLLQKRYFRQEDGKFIQKVFSNFQKDSNLLLLLYALGREDLHLYASEVFVISLHCEEEHQERLFQLLEEIAEFEDSKAVRTERDLEKKHRMSMEIKKIFLEGLVNYKNYLMQTRTHDPMEKEKTELEIENSIVKALKKNDSFCSSNPETCSKGCTMNLIKIVGASPSTGNYHLYAFSERTETPDHLNKLKWHINEAMVRILNEKHTQGIPSMIEGIKYWIKTFFNQHLSIHKKSFLRDAITKMENSTFVLHNPQKKIMHILSFTRDYGL